MVEKTIYNSNKNIKCLGINLTFKGQYETLVFSPAVRTLEVGTLS